MIEGRTLTEAERRTLVALATVQPATFQVLAERAGYGSISSVVDVVRRLRRRGFIRDERHRRSLSYNPSHSLRLADGIIVTERGQVGRWVGLS